MNPVSCEPQTIFHCRSPGIGALQEGLCNDPTPCDTPVQVPQQRDVEWRRELAVALGPACYSLLVCNEGQPEALVAAQGLLEGCTLAQAACVWFQCWVSSRKQEGRDSWWCVAATPRACVCKGREGGR